MSWLATVLGQARDLGLPRDFVSRRILALGLTIPHKKEPPWNAAEEHLLGAFPLGDLKRAADIFAEHGFRRSPASIGNKAKRLGVSRRWSATLSCRGAALILGIDDKTVAAWILAGALAAEKRETLRTPQQGGDPWSISRASLRRFVIDHLEHIDIRKVEKFAFVQLLTETPPS